MAGLRLFLFIAVLASSSFAGGGRTCAEDLSSRGLFQKEMAEFAQRIGLHYQTDEGAGITRTRRGDSFIYRESKGVEIVGPRVLARIKALRIPPGYKEVWISPDPKSHLQAVGWDDRGRKQYCYHPAWTEARAAHKFNRMGEFGRQLPALRRMVKVHLGRRGLPREKVLAAVVALLDRTLIRVGNEEYAVDNETFGLTTLRDHHIKVKGSTITFDFTGKSHKDHFITLQHARLAAIVAECKALSGEHVFQYIDGEGAQHIVTSEDVNEYIDEISEGAFTAKDFRTWGGTVLAAEALHHGENIQHAIEFVASKLGNTPAVARKSYVHPTILSAFVRGERFENAFRGAQRRVSEELSAAEAAALSLLE